MKTQTRSLVFAVAALIGVVAVARADNDFCWKSSYGRGGGTIPKACGPGREMIGALCYSKCPAGMKRVGVDCHSVCPAGLRDDGLFCRAAEYGRGAGYPWQAGDPPGDDKKMYQRCESDHGRGNCEKTGLIVYPKCKPGYSAAGCCICRPQQPDCGALGLNPGTDLSCAKKVSVGDPVPGVCGAGEQYDGGLCYKSCNSGYSGIGPVCWGSCPASHPVSCGAGCATTASACASNTTEQVMSVLEVVANVGLAIVTAGASTAATTAAKGAATGAKQTVKTGVKVTGKLTKDTVVQTIKTQAKDLAKNVAESAVQTYAEAVVQVGSTGEFDPEILAGLDPTGIASLVVAYAKPVCAAPAGAPTTPAATRGPSITSSTPCGQLAVGGRLKPGGKITSCNGTYSFVFQADSNAVVYKGGAPLWASNTSGKNAGYLTFQHDGNLCLYTAASRVVWCNMVHGFASPALRMQDDGNLCVYSGTTPKWCTNTHGR